MRTILPFICFFLFTIQAFSQSLYPPPLSSDAPEWVKEMLKPNPNVFIVKDLYKSHYKNNAFVKNNYTQFYKKWIRIAELYTGSDGHIHRPDAVQELQMWSDFTQQINSVPQRGGQGWTSIGPFETVWDQDNGKSSWQVNVYNLDQSKSNPDILYCTTEGAEIYKSTDHGINWYCVSRGLIMNSSEAIQIHPLNPEIVYCGSGNFLYKTSDGGTTWNIVYTSNGFDCTDIIVNPQNPSIVMACGANGLVRTTDDGQTWTSILTDRVWDIEFKPGNPLVVYAAKTNPAVSMCEFFKSTDGGITFTIRTNGFYTSADVTRNDQGARIACTPANPEVIYTYLIGQSKDGDNGFIGIWKSTNSGEDWNLPHGQVGGPYTCTDATAVATCPYPNLATIGPTGNYHQGFYNMDIVVSSTDENALLIGGCSLWRSTDGAASYMGVGGYSGNVGRIHPDIQDLLVRGNEVWLCTDGGVNYSTDFMTTHESRKYGITGSDYWGFGSGWNDDVLVGGRYHNGNSGIAPGYPAMTHIRLGGAENATGYINPGNNRLAYFSDIGNLLMPGTISSPIQWMPSGMYPNESYWASEYSDMVFSPSCYNHIWIGKDNKLYKSEDGGVNYALKYTFGTTTGDWIGPIEIGYRDENIMYALQFKYSNNTSQLWKSTDGGVSWNALTMPPGYSRISSITISPDNSQVVWLSYRQAANGQKIYKSTNGGTSWINLTTGTLNGESAQYLLAQAGTDGGVYLATGRTVFYRNNSMSDWTPYNGNLPASVSTMRLRPFYRDNKIRMASYGKGLWEAPLYELPQSIVCRAIVDKKTAFCPTDTFHFDDYSTLNHSAATWSWTFENGTPAVSTQRNPSVVFGSTGTFRAVLKITDGAGHSDSDTLYVEVTGYTANTIQEGFEGNFPPYAWKPFNPPNGEPSWKQANTGAYGQSQYCMVADNYNNDGNHTYDDFGTGINLNNTLEAMLTFDVAYAKYGGQYSDTLEVIVSTDCGTNFTAVYRKGGSDLATAPDNSTSMFVPTAIEWRTDSVSLSNYLNEANLIVAFRNIANYGQPIYIDNVNIQTKINDVSVKPLEHGEHPELYPNPVVSGNILNVKGVSESMLTVFNGEGKPVIRGKGGSLEARLKSGIYLVEIETGVGIYYRKLVVY